MPHPILVLHAALGAAAVVVAAASGVARAGDDPLRVNLARLAERRVFFGHQSVGMNLMDGLGRLAAERGVALRIAEASAAAGVPAATFGHAFMAANGDPRRKLASFEQAFASGAARGAEVALLKLCYVDFDAGTDAAALFAQYQATLARLRAAHPEVTFVHVTVPLQRVPSGLQATVKRWLGRPGGQATANARREEYNALLRRAYDGREPLFDLARVEATRPDGTLETAEVGGRAVPAMVARYTDDGGHLNREGQDRAARALVAVLAAAPVRAAAAEVGR